VTANDLESRVRTLLANYRELEAAARAAHDRFFAEGQIKQSEAFRVIAGWHARFAYNLEELLDGED
jgi:hypothetical protein